MLLVQVAEEVGVGQWFVIHPREASGRGHIVIIQRSHRRGQSLVRIIGFDQDVFEWAIAVTFLESGIDLVIFREFGGPGTLNFLTRTRLDTGNCLLAPAGQVRGGILEGPFAHRARLFHTVRCRLPSSGDSIARAHSRSGPVSHPSAPSQSRYPLSRSIGSPVVIPQAVCPLQLALSMRFEVVGNPGFANPPGDGRIPCKVEVLPQLAGHRTTNQ